MGTHQTTPIAGILLAVVTCAALLMLGVDLGIAIAILVVWVATLFLAVSRPPERPTPVVEKSLSQDSLRDLIENSSIPLLVTDKNTVAIANKEARKLLGLHILGQDARVAFRQPEVISLFNEDRNGQAIIRGLVRRQDIWHVSRHAIDQNRAVMDALSEFAAS